MSRMTYEEWFATLKEELDALFDGRGDDPNPEAFRTYYDEQLSVLEAINERIGQWSPLTIEKGRY